MRIRKSNPIPPEPTTFLDPATGETRTRPTSHDQPAANPAAPAGADVWETTPSARSTVHGADSSPREDGGAVEQPKRPRRFPAGYDWRHMAAVPGGGVLAPKPQIPVSTPSTTTVGAAARRKRSSKRYEIFPFGKYNRKRTMFADIPSDYLVWCIENIMDMEDKWPGLFEQMQDRLENERHEYDREDPWRH